VGLDRDTLVKVPGHSGLFGREDRYRCDYNRLLKDFGLVHDRLLTKLAASGVDSRVVVWVGRTQRVIVGGQLSEEVKVISGVPQGSVLGPVLFLVYVNDICRNIDSSIRLFADDCIIICKKITKYIDIENL